MTKHTLRTALRTGFALCAALAVVALTTEPVSPQAQADGRRVPRGLRDRADRGERVRVLVELNLQGHVAEGRLAAAARSVQRQRLTALQNRVLSRLAPSEHAVLHRFATLPYVALEVDASALDALERAAGDVVQVLDDKMVRPVLSESVPIIQADQAWAGGYDGSGTTIAVLDTGVDRTHPFLAGKVVAEACYSSNQPFLSSSFCPNHQSQQIGPGTAVPCTLEGCMHGTHVAGIALGNGQNAGQPFSGVAKGANLMAVQVFSQVNNVSACGGMAPCLGGFTSDIIAGLERVYAAAPSLNIVAVNLSLGEGQFFEHCDNEPYKPIIDSLRAIGVATVVASGNDGYTDAMLTPACVSSAVSVGATDKGDNVAWFSNVTSFLSLFSPGDLIVSSVPGGDYEMVSGTSMAAPHVAGVWAVLKQAVPNASVSTLLQALQQTGTPISDWRPEGTVTVPRVNLYEALETLVPLTNPEPEITAIEPTHAKAMSQAFQLTVTGSGFNIHSVVKWNGSERPTTVVSSTTLVAQIPASDLDVSSAGSADISVFTPAPGGGTSSSVALTIDPPPSISVSATTVEGGSSVTMTLHDGFGGMWDWLALALTTAPNNSYVQTVYVGDGVTSRSWTVTAPTTTGTYEFRLFINGYNRVATSAPITVTPAPSPVPVITTLSPTRIVAGTTSLTLNVNGSDFATSSIVRWKGSDRPTTYVSATQLRASIPATDLASATTAGITVFTPAPGGGLSASVPFTVDPPPALAVDTTTAPGGSPVTVTLTNGLGGSLDWLAFAPTGAPNTTFSASTYVGTGVTTRTWTVSVPSAAGTYEFRLFKDGYTRLATSPAITVTAPLNPVPVLTSLSPTHIVAGTAGLTLTVNGSNFTSASGIRWNGSGRATTYVSATQLRATVLPADLSTAGTAAVTVFTPAPGGGLSAPASFAVDPPPQLTVDTTNASGATPVTVTLTNGLGGSMDWLALAATSAADSSYIQTTYVGTGVTTRTWTVTLPSTTGTYEFRLFTNGYARVATSPAITVLPPAPVVSSISPVSLPAGAAPFTLTVNGSNFLASSVVRWNGSDRATTFVNATQLRANISTSDIATVGTAQVTVFNPAPGGGVSTPRPFSITDPPTLAVNTTNAAGGSPVTVTLGNSSGSSMDWLALALTGAPDNSYLQSSYVGAGVTSRTWTATMPSTAGTYEFRLFTNGYTRLATSPAVTVTAPPSSVPTLTSIAPNHILAGTPGLTLTVNGSNFVSTSVVRWNGSDRATTYVNAAQIRATITAADLASVTTASVAVFTPAPGGGLSAALPFLVDPPPALSVDTTSAPGATPVTVTLTNGLGGSLDWLAFAATSAGDSSSIQTTYVGTGVTTRTWTVTLPSTTGTYEFRLFTNGYTRLATSPAITVLPPAPVVSSISPATMSAGAAPFTLTVNGSNFVTGSVVRWNGSDRATTFVNSTQVRAAISASDIANIGTAQVTVFNPAPGGGVSAPRPFSITQPPTLAVSSNNVAGGASVTVTLANGSGSSSDWMALAASTAPDTSYLLSTYVGTGITSRTWTVTMPTTPGTYEFRLLTNGYTRLTTSPAVTVTPPPSPIPVVTSLSPTGVLAGTAGLTLTVNGSSFVSSSVVRWNGSDRATTYVSALQLRATITPADLATTTTASVTVFTPAPGGGSSAAASFTVDPPPVLTVNTTNPPGGTPVTVTLTNGTGGPSDWMALASATSPNTSYIVTTYVGAGVTSRTWTATIPTTPGTYEFRLFVNGTYTRVATSPTITVATTP
jgi:subtilisin family serine protease